LLLFFKEL